MPGEDRDLEEAVKEVRAEDAARDHSFQGLSEEEKLEIDIFKTMKRDPYYKHYIENVIWENSENHNETIVNAPMLFTGSSVKDRVKWDKTNYPTLQQAKELSELDDDLIDG